jgi:hypothetical protein
MQTAYLLDDVVVLLRHWYEVGPRDEEHGCRVEIRTIARPAHIGTESASQPVTLDAPLWRADIFDLVGPPPGNLQRAHYHPSFNGREPVDRHWDPRLKSDWRGWLGARLADLPATLAAVAPMPGLGGADRLARVLPDLLDRAETMLGESCNSHANCLAATLDTREAVELMLGQFRPPGTPDPRTAASS